MVIKKGTTMNKFDEVFKSIIKQDVDTSLDLFDPIKNKKHIQKMKAYYQKGSNVSRLIESIHNNDKLLHRWAAALMIGWADAERAFANELVYKNILTKEQIEQYKAQYNTNTNNEATSQIEVRGKLEEDISQSWLSKSAWKFFNSLKDYGYTIEWEEGFTRARTPGGQEAMERNGRAWTEGFVVNVSKGETNRRFTFDVISNQGGGLYGYSIIGGPISLREFKIDIINSLIDEFKDESLKDLRNQLYKSDRKRWW